MKKTEIIDFFNKCATKWDEEMIRDDEVVHEILNYAKVSEGKEILDVACGTGVLIPDYLKRKVKSITAIDISPEMVKIARQKFPQESVEIICGDVETQEFKHKFDCIVVYNAFPHFVDSEKLISHLSSLLKKDGILTIAHGMSRAKLNYHHHNISEEVRHDLIEADELAKIISDYLEITTIISNDRMYQVSGKKR